MVLSTMQSGRMQACVSVGHVDPVVSVIVTQLIGVGESALRTRVEHVARTATV